MSETPATATCAAWSNLNGQVTCPAHAPTSLTAALERAPSPSRSAPTTTSGPASPPRTSSSWPPTSTTRTRPDRSTPARPAATPPELPCARPAPRSRPLGAH